MIGTLEREQTASPGIGARSPQPTAATPPAPRIPGAQTSLDDAALGPVPPRPRAWAWAALTGMLATCTAAAILLSADTAEHRDASTTVTGAVSAAVADAGRPTGTTVAAGSAAAGPETDRCTPPIPSWWPCPASAAVP